jgi:hypothetical protein
LPIAYQKNRANANYFLNAKKKYKNRAGGGAILSGVWEKTIRERKPVVILDAVAAV